ncbi:MAG: hypothetical protein AB1797_08930 [bacterium]
MFESRQEGDYKELVEISGDDAARYVEYAGEFLQAIKELINE